ncbi:unnamed protein product [Caenorhabditis sp. 36 PRJEB53466]|nr:unnamed protein product [Caenorhabditis sp. 36 PRJEB53466]
MQTEIPEDIFRRIVGFSTSSRSIFELWNLNSTARDVLSDEVAKLSRKEPIRVDIGQFFLENNPFQREFYEIGNAEHKKRLHEKIWKLARLLERLLRIGNGFQIDNLTASALGIQAETDERYLDRAPSMLQKKMVHILSQFRSTEIFASTVFMRPSRVIRSFRNRFETITVLDLGNMKPLAAMKLRSNVFPSLENLEKLTWHMGNVEYLDKIPNKDRLRSLDLTCHIVGEMSAQKFEVLRKFHNLERFFLGISVPHRPTRMVMDIILNLYQSIWRRKSAENQQLLMESFPNVREMGFWNSPERLFQQMVRKGIEYETLNFGALSQNLHRLCSFDSILQSFFKWEEAETVLPPPVIRHLNMNLHTMPAIGLDYYLPNLMDRINKVPSLESVSLFFKCIYHNEMTSSWSMETSKQKSGRRRPVFDANYTHFSLHSEGLCGLKDLDRQLPPSLETCSISLNLPSESAQTVFKSVLKFIEKLGSLNDFPELVEFHIQILGLKCFELLTHTIAESFGAHLRRVSILAPPQNTDKSVAKGLIRQMPEMFPKAERLALSTEFLRILMKAEHQKSPQWSEKIRKLARKSGFDAEKCHVTTGQLPIGDFVAKGDEPAEIEELPDIELPQNVEFEENDVEDEEDDFIDNENDSEHVESHDDLDDLERKLEAESDRRHKKWQKKRGIEAESDEDDEENKENEEEEEDDDDVIDWDQLDELDEEEDSILNGMIDNEAVESDGEESGGDEEEPEGEDLADSDDERLFAHGPRGRKRRGAEPHDNGAKRRRIVVSDDEDD